MRAGTRRSKIARPRSVRRQVIRRPTRWCVTQLWWSEEADSRSNQALGKRLKNTMYGSAALARSAVDSASPSGRSRNPWSRQMWFALIRISPAFVVGSRRGGRLGVRMEAFAPKVPPRCAHGSNAVASVGIATVVPVEARVADGSQSRFSHRHPHAGLPEAEAANDPIC
jgi:hypothetical protein